jgi:hypothetical protein
VNWFTDLESSSFPQQPGSYEVKMSSLHPKARRPRIDMRTDEAIAQPDPLSRSRPTANRLTRRDEGTGIVCRTNMRMLDDQDVVRVLRSEVERAGGQSSWARRERIDRSLLNRVLRGRKPPTKRIIKALKLCNAYALNGEIAG